MLMKKIALISLQRILIGFVLLGRKTMATAVPEPLVMLLFGTTPLTIATILLKVTVRHELYVFIFAAVGNIVLSAKWR